MGARLQLITHTVLLTPSTAGESADLALEHVERPEFARRPDRSALTMLSVPRRNVSARHPSLEILLRAPARHHQAHFALIVGAKQLEPFEAGGALDLPRSRRESLPELGEPLTRDGDRVDLDDAHTRDPAGRPPGPELDRTAA
jgi:hypothetical protein